MIKKKKINKKSNRKNYLDIYNCNKIIKNNNPFY